MAKRYLKGFINFPADQASRADNYPISDTVERWDHEDGSVTINELQYSPVQAGQCEWIGRGL